MIRTHGTMGERVPESEIQKQVLEYLALRGHFHWRQGAAPVPIRQGGEIKGLRPAWCKGVADILGIVRGSGGRMFAIEVKASTGGKLSVDQKCFLDDVKKHGGLSIVARSLDDVMNAGL